MGEAGKGSASRRAGFAILWLLGVVGITLTGCRTPTAATTAVVTTGASSDTEIVSQDPELLDILVFKEFRTRRGPANFLEIQASVENRSVQTVRFEYRWEWVDSSGFKISNPAEAWVPKVVQGYGVSELSGVSPTTGAQTAKLHVRHPVEVKPR